MELLRATGLTSLGGLLWRLPAPPRALGVRALRCVWVLPVPMVPFSARGPVLGFKIRQ